MVPDVSAVITCFNESHVIIDAVASACAQTSARLVDIVVVDDGSTDGSADLVEKRFGHDGRVRVIRQENRGLPGARNTGIRESMGAWIALLDGDDLWEPGRISAALEAIAANPGAGLVYGDFVLFTGTASRIVRVNAFDGTGGPAIAALLERGGPIVPSSVTVCRSLLEHVGGFDEKLRSAEDTDMWIRCLAVAEAVRIPEALVRKRDHPRSLGKKRDLKVAAMRRVVDKAVAAHPEVAQAGRRRIARSLAVQSRQAAASGAVAESLKAALAAIRQSPTSVRGWTALAAAPARLASVRSRRDH